LAKEKKSMHAEKIAFVLVFGRLAWLAAVCPCTPLFKCHSTEALVLSLGAAATITYRQFSAV
jgi:hypothetical protein